MPSKRSTERPPKLLPTLTVALEEAHKQIDTQIAKGREIRSRNITTPTMLLTGEQDYRTPISEAEQFYQALKLRKVDTALVRIPRE